MRQTPAPATFLALLIPLATVGCGTLSPRCPSVIASPSYYAPDLLPEARNLLDRGQELEAAGDVQCIEAYFQACWFAWQALDTEAGAAAYYNEAVAHLLIAAARMGRLDPARSLMIGDSPQSKIVPVAHHRFAWQATDFQQLHLPPNGYEPLLSRHYGHSGIGLPLVVERLRNSGDPIESRFLPQKSFFAATAVLRFDPAAGQEDLAAVLEFHNPLPPHGVSVGTGEIPMAADFTAPVAKTLEVAPRTYFAGFIEPGQAATTTARLSFLEPYQPGKVPIVLIHGLYSDPQSWADLINDLRVAPGFLDRFQLWVFRYPTGQGFLQSAAALRTELREAVGQLESRGGDPALHNIVLIGHSMGGLVAKLQVTHSEDVLWSRLANRPLEQIVTTERTRAVLAETCYFDPSPDVTRVVFIASPHGGALPSSALVGQGASLLVEPAPEQAAMHEQLIRDNPDTFNPLVERRMPTSIDMLTRESPLLDAMRIIRVRPGVQLHNIIGDSHWISLDGPSDGVVSVASATHPSQSTLHVDASHTQVHRAMETTAEILRILESAPKPSTESL